MPVRAALFLLLLAIPLQAQVAADAYVNKGSRLATIRATLALHGLHDLSGDWHYAGPFDNPDRKGFDTIYPPEKGVDLKATYNGKGGVTVAWKKLEGFEPGKMVDLRRIFRRTPNDAVVYLYHAFESEKAMTLSLSLGSDDTLTLWCNGERVIHEDHERAAVTGQFQAEWKIKPGKNELLAKVCQYGGEWQFVAEPGIAPSLPEAVQKRIDRDYPAETVAKNTQAVAANEAKYYSITTIEPPKECVLEVGGLGMRSDGKLLACTRRGEIWLIHNPTAMKDFKFTRFASGLHEPLGIHLENDRTLTVIQRPELTRVIDVKGDDTASEFTTLCDAWGVSGGYHEYAFGPAKDKDGNYFVTLNVGFSSGGQSPVPWRGWCVKIDPKGKMEPWAYGLRSPNGVNFSPDGDLFYCDNQGEWVATNKMHHLKKGKFYGHQASLAWVKDSPFSSQPSKVKSGMMYDGQAGPTGAKGMPDVDLPCIWFPYGRMGQSASEPRWDTTKGKFGPFAGQCFVGDQTRSCVMRVALEKVNDVWQGACFPFRNGLQCGVNRLLFDDAGHLYVGETNRGWGSVGGKPYGLQRIDYTGELPFEIQTMTVTKAGFDLTFTKPVKDMTADAITLKSYTYIYHSNYGCPETDTQGEPIELLKVEGNRVSLAVANRKPGRVYDLRAAGVRSTGGEPLLHPEAYYTLNEVPK